MGTFERISQLAQQLNDSSDEINRVIRQANEKLGDMNIGLEVWLDEQSDPGLDDEGMILGYAKAEDGWQLVVKSLRVRAVIGQIAEPLTKQSRNVRVRAVGLIPKLLSRIADQAETLLDGIKGAKQELEKM